MFYEEKNMVSDCRFTPDIFCHRAHSDFAVDELFLTQLNASFISTWTTFFSVFDCWCKRNGERKVLCGGPRLEWTQINISYESTNLCLSLIKQKMDNDDFNYKWTYVILELFHYFFAVNELTGSMAQNSVFILPARLWVSSLVFFSPFMLPASEVLEAFSFFFCVNIVRMYEDKCQQCWPVVQCFASECCVPSWCFSSH